MEGFSRAAAGAFLFLAQRKLPQRTSGAKPDHVRRASSQRLKRCATQRQLLFGGLVGRGTGSTIEARAVS